MGISKETHQTSLFKWIGEERLGGNDKDCLYTQGIESFGDSRSLKSWRERANRNKRLLAGRHQHYLMALGTEKNLTELV